MSETENGNDYALKLNSMSSIVQVIIIKRIISDSKCTKGGWISLVFCPEFFHYLHHS